MLLWALVLFEYGKLAAIYESCKSCGIFYYSGSSNGSTITTTASPPELGDTFIANLYRSHESEPTPGTSGARTESTKGSADPEGEPTMRELLSTVRDQSKSLNKFFAAFADDSDAGPSHSSNEEEVFFNKVDFDTEHISETEGDIDSEDDENIKALMQDYVEETDEALNSTSSQTNGSIFHEHHC